MKQLLTIFVLIALAIPTWAGEKTITISRNDVDWENANTVYSISKSGVQLVMPGGMNNPNFLLMKQQTTMTIKSVNFKIKKIVFHCLDNTNVNAGDETFYNGPQTMHVKYNTTHGETPGTYTTPYNGSTYDGCWVSTPTYPEGLPLGYELMFENGPRPIRFASVDIVIEQEFEDEIYELVTDNSEIEVSTADNQARYIIVNRRDAETTQGRALSVNQQNNSTSGHFLSTPVDILDNGIHVKPTDEVMIVTFEASGDTSHPYYVKGLGNYLRSESAKSDDNSYRISRSGTVSSSSTNYFRTSININQDNGVNNWGHYATISYEALPNFSIRVVAISSGDQFRNYKTNYSSAQRSYLYRPAKRYEVTTEINPNGDYGSISLRDGVITEEENNVVKNWSQKMETVQFLVTPADGKRIASVTIAYADDATTTITPLTVSPSINGTLYTFEMPGHNVHITATFVDVVYHDIFMEVKPNADCGNIFLTDGYVVQNDQVKSYEGENVLFNVTPNFIDIEHVENGSHELESVTVTYKESGETITYNLADGNYNFTMPNADVLITAYFKYTPLHWIEENGVKDNPYTVSDRLQGVYAHGASLWCKDLGNISIIKTEPASNQEDYLMNDNKTKREGGWDQSNWVELDFSELNDGVQLASQGVNKFIGAGSVKGVYVDDINYRIKLSQNVTLDGSPSYVPNYYCTVNFLEANLGVPGPINGNTNYYFLNPKIQEYAIVTYAMWMKDQQIFVVPNTSGFSGAFRLGGWDYNEFGNQKDNLDAASPENIYEFHILVQRDSKNYGTPLPKTSGKPGQTASTVLKVQPLDLRVNSAITAINTVGTQVQPVSVEYVNLTGMRSSTPFNGVNIMVTRYSDGTFSTTKVIK